MGTCFAAAPAGAEDITQQFFNPCVPSFFRNEEFAAVGSVLFPKDNFHDAAGVTYTGDTITGVTDPSHISAHIGGGALYGAFCLTNKIHLGIAITTPWRKKTNYSYDWIGRYYGTRFEMIGFNIAPTLSWSIHDIFHFGIGPQFQGISLSFAEAIDFGSIGEELGIEGAVPGSQDGFLHVTGNNWAVGWVAGVTISPCWYIRLGAGYRSPVCHNICASTRYELNNMGAKVNLLSGTYTQACAAEVNLTTPRCVFGGFNYIQNDCLQIMGSLSIIEWSGSDNIFVNFSKDSSLNTTIVGELTNSVHLAAGFKYSPFTREWYLRAGGLYRGTPMKGGAQNPLFFGDDNWSLGVGLGRVFCGCLELDAAWIHTFPFDVSIDQTTSGSGNSLRGDLTGKIHSKADWLSFSAKAIY